MNRWSDGSTAISAPGERCSRVMAARPIEAAVLRPTGSTIRFSGGQVGQLLARQIGVSRLYQHQHSLH